MPPKAPTFAVAGQPGVVKTEDAVQFGCAYCLGEGLMAPAEHHVAYFWAGTSFCSKHLMEFFKVQNAQVVQPTQPAS